LNFYGRDKFGILGGKRKYLGGWGGEWVVVEEKFSLIYKSKLKFEAQYVLGLNLVGIGHRQLLFAVL
jgi:hypothetical protein